MTKPETRRLERRLERLRTAELEHIERLEDEAARQASSELTAQEHEVARTAFHTLVKDRTPDLQKLPENQRTLLEKLLARCEELRRQRGLPDED